MDTGEICEYCGRPVLWRQQNRHNNPSSGSYCYVVHDYYGCDTGCCGYRACLCDTEGRVVADEFNFYHPKDEKHFHEYVEDFVRQFWCSIPIDFEKCEYSEYC